MTNTNKNEEIEAYKFLLPTKLSPGPTYYQLFKSILKKVCSLFYQNLPSDYSLCHHLLIVQILVTKKK